MSTPYARVVALDPASGKEKWAFQLPSGNPSTRGLEYWPGDATTPAQIVFGTSDAKLYSIDAATGTPNRAFGDGGVVNLDTPEILRGLPGRNGLTSPPIVYKHLVITGGTTQENPPRGPAGDVRAWDMHTGKLAWTFRSVPQAGERFSDTWGGDSWKNRSGVNVWGFFSVDTARGIVYMPFGAPSVDQYGGDRRRRQPVRDQPGRGQSRDRRVPVALPAHASRHLGRRSRRRSGAPRRDARRQDDPRRRRGQQAGAAVPPRSHHRQADRRRRGAAGAGERGAARAGREDAAVPARHAAAVAHEHGRRATSRPSRRRSKPAAAR